MAMCVPADAGRELGLRDQAYTYLSILGHSIDRSLLIHTNSSDTGISTSSNRYAEASNQAVVEHAFTNNNITNCIKNVPHIYTFSSDYIILAKVR